MTKQNVLKLDSVFLGNVEERCLLESINREEYIKELEGLKDKRRILNLHKKIEEKLRGYCVASRLEYSEFNTRELSKISSRGEYFEGKDVKCVFINKKHFIRNTVELWKINHKIMNLAIFSGYALNEGGTWKRHNWLLSDEGGEKRIIETTSDVKMSYFGYELTHREASRLYQENF